jgi:hypothetical protein
MRRALTAIAALVCAACLGAIVAPVNADWSMLTNALVILADFAGAIALAFALVFVPRCASVLRRINNRLYARQ